jgi:hypothetical protein
MAKKKKAAKAAKRGKAAPARKVKAKAARVSKVAAKSRARKRMPAQQSFDGFRHRDCDRICQGIAETRGEMNRLRGEETDLELQALKAMRAHDITAYQHAGVELVRVPGEEKLRVRTARERTATAETAEVEPEGEAVPQGEDNPAALGSVN